MTGWKIVTFFIAVSFAVMPANAERHTPSLPMVPMDEQGSHMPQWLYQSTFDLRKDLAATEQQGRRLVILWEQPDCLYCKPMYEVNLRIPRVVDKINKSFNVIKLNIWGDRQVTDLDGSVSTETELAEKYNVQFTPSVQFLAESVAKADGMNGKDSEAFRIEGYFKPFHFYFLFHYVLTRGYESEPNFQRWLGNIGRGMQADSIEYDLYVDALPVNLPNKY